MYMVRPADAKRNACSFMVFYLNFELVNNEGHKLTFLYGDDVECFKDSGEIFKMIKH